LASQPVAKVDYLEKYINRSTPPHFCYALRLEAETAHNQCRGSHPQSTKLLQYKNEWKYFSP
ncbi:hypothetical protein KKF55_00490, partial [Patescibacteria group bacterium]|nr:hypothetical protein [Patescibacteria group bacterium]